jgi:hypothetical protein
LEPIQPIRLIFWEVRLGFSPNWKSKDLSPNFVRGRDAGDPGDKYLIKQLGGNV